MRSSRAFLEGQQWAPGRCLLHVSSLPSSLPLGVCGFGMASRSQALERTSAFCSSSLAPQVAATAQPMEVRKQLPSPQHFLGGLPPFISTVIWRGRHLGLLDREDTEEVVVTKPGAWQ